MGNHLIHSFVMSFVMQPKHPYKHDSKPRGAIVREIDGVIADSEEFA